MIFIIIIITKIVIIITLKMTIKWWFEQFIGRVSVSVELAGG